MRQEKSLPLLDKFNQWVDDFLRNVSPSNPLINAATYAKNQRPFINRCFTDGRFEIDNGRVEREIREPAIGRKNYLFAGSSVGASSLAAAYTVVQSARKCGINVRDYLIDILTRLDNGWPAKKLTELLPDKWVRERSLIATAIID